MYAETFDVRGWLETPAKWLRWAMQSLTARNLKDVDYNLHQFWQTLSPLKNGSLGAQDWGEILTLDAQSQWTLGNLYQDTATQILLETNDLDALGSLGFAGQGWIPDSILVDVFGSDIHRTAREGIDALNQAAEQTFETAQAMSIQAEAALSSVGAPVGQAGNTVIVASNSVASAPDNAAWQRRQLEEIAKDNSAKKALEDLLNSLKNPLGVPWYYWAAGAVLLLVLLTPRAPQISVGGKR